MKLTVKEILFGDSDRDCPDDVDKAVLAEIAKAGSSGMTTEALVITLLGRAKLTKTEQALVDFAEELDQLGQHCSPEFVDMIDSGEIRDSGRRENGRIIWLVPSDLIPKH